MSERGAMYKVRSSELKARLSSSDDPVEVGEDTVSPSFGRLGLSLPLGRSVA